LKKVRFFSLFHTYFLPAANLQVKLLMTLLLTPRLLVRALKSLARKRETVFHQKKRGRGVRKKLRAAVSADTSTRKYTLAPFSKI
jgi:hypothetical protein